MRSRSSDSCTLRGNMFMPLTMNMSSLRPKISKRKPPAGASVREDAHRMVRTQMNSRQAHLDKIYGSKSVTDVSWYEAHPAKSLELIRATGVRPTDPIIDVGGGASLLVDELLDAGYRDLTVLDISPEVLQKLRERLGARAASVAFIQQDGCFSQPGAMHSGTIAQCSIF